MWTSSYAQTVPNTTTYCFSDVTAVVGGTCLSEAFTNAIDSHFDPTYKGSKNSLSNFRNYNNFYSSSNVCDVFTKNDCPDGFTGETGVVCVEDGHSISWVSQEVANALAEGYLQGGFGQSFANEFFGCTEDPGGCVYPSGLSVSVSDISYTGVTLNGSVSSDNGHTITDRGFCYGSAYDALTCVSSGSGTGSFSTNLTGLTAGRLYYVGSYATNECGTSYTLNIEFTTSSYTYAPSVSTLSTTNILTNAATSGCNVTDEGSSSVTTRGVCYSTSANPTTANGVVSGGSGSGSINITIYGLSPNTTYHVRAYATNSTGTSYGSDVSFTTLTERPSGLAGAYWCYRITRFYSASNTTEDFYQNGFTAASQALYDWIYHPLPIYYCDLTNILTQSRLYAIGDTVYARNETYGNTVMADGWYIQEYDGYPRNLYHVVSGVITEIVMANKD